MLLRAENAIAGSLSSVFGKTRIGLEALSWQTAKLCPILARPAEETVRRWSVSGRARRRLDASVIDEFAVETTLPARFEKVRVGKVGFRVATPQTVRQRLGLDSLTVKRIQRSCNRAIGGSTPVNRSLAAITWDVHCALRRRLYCLDRQMRPECQRLTVLLRSSEWDGRRWRDPAGLRRIVGLAPKVMERSEDGPPSVARPAR